MFEGVTTTYKRTSKFSKQEYQDEEHTIPATSSTITNNMLRYWVQEDEHNLLTDCITVTSNGINSGYVTYQNKMFAIAQDSYALMLHKKGVGELHYLYLMGVMNKKFSRTYDYQNKAVWSRVKDDYIELPLLTTDSTEPYWDYMAYFIHNIQQQYADQLEAKTEYELNLMCQLLGVTRDDIVQRLEFTQPQYTNTIRIDELFEINRGDISNQGNLVETGVKEGIAFIAQNDSNNGYVKKVESESYKVFKGRNIVIGRQTGAVYYQDEEFVTTDGVLVLSSKHILNKEIGLYLVTIIKKHLENSGYNNTVSATKLNKIELELPVIAPNSNQIDWVAIRNFTILGGINYLATRMEVSNRDLAIIRQIIQ